METVRDELFFSFLRSRGGSFSARMSRAAADGTTATVALRFWMVSLTVTFRPFQSEVPLAISSPTFLGDCTLMSQNFHWFKYQTKRTDLGGKSGTTRYLTAGDTAVDCKTRRRSNGVQSRLAAARAVYDADSSISRAY